MIDKANYTELHYDCDINVRLLVLSFPSPPKKKNQNARKRECLFLHLSLMDVKLTHEIFRAS